MNIFPIIKKSSDSPDKYKANLPMPATGRVNWSLVKRDFILLLAVKMYYLLLLFSKRICSLPSARAVLGEYRPEVLTVRAERSEVRTKKTKGRYSSSTVPSKVG